ncbi:hypothetical protein AB2S25_18550, partial [Elizabethkingia anophelis]
SNSATNYGTGVKLGSLLFLPAAGYRGTADGSLGTRGFDGHYWSSSEAPFSANYLSFSSSNVNVYYSDRPLGFPVRCVAL